LDSVDPSRAPVLSPIRRQVLATVVRHGPISRAELAHHLPQSRSRLSPEIAAMLATGTLREAPRPEATGGRRGTVLRAGAGEIAVVGGIDIDARSVSVALTGIGGDLVSRDQLPLDAGGDPARALEEAERMLRAALDADCGPLAAIGVSIAADVDPRNGEIATAPTMPRWTGLAVAAELGRRFEVRTFVDNDVNALALAEAFSPDPLRPAGSAFLVVKLSSGVGCGIVAGETLFRGTGGFAGDIGHICVDPADPTPCACGNRGCLEALIGERALGEAPGRALLARSGRHLGFVLAGLASFFDPALIRVASSLGERAPTLLTAAEREIAERTTRLPNGLVPILPTRLGPTDGALAAAALGAAGFLGAAGAVADSRFRRDAVAA
jgi:predicted NBD/HSP70 family sugar kinase